MDASDAKRKNGPDVPLEYVVRNAAAAAAFVRKKPRGANRKNCLLALALGVAFLVCAGAVNAASAMQLYIRDAGLPIQAELVGEINPGDADRIIGALEHAKPSKLISDISVRAPSQLYDSRQWLWVRVESPGGDIDDAMKIGRYLRSANALIAVAQQCNSSCVFLLAGATERINLDAVPGKVGVHRPYFQNAPAGADFERMFGDMHMKVVAYLQEMRVSTTLGDVMFAIPPEKLGLLSPEEIRLLLPVLDPVWDESTTARRAAIYGTDGEGYRRQAALASWECEKTQGNVSAERLILHASDCQPAHSLGVPIDEFTAMAQIFSGRCALPPSTYGVIRAGNSDFASCSDYFGGSAAGLGRDIGDNAPPVNQAAPVVSHSLLTVASSLIVDGAPP